MSESVGLDNEGLHILQSLSNVQLSPCVNTTGHCHQSSQQAGGRVNDVSIMQLGQKLEKYKHPR